MKILLVALNAKYIHSSLAVRSLFSYCEQFKDSLSVKEFTINQEEGLIISELYKQKPDVLCFSCYIWNISIIKSVIQTIKKVLPKTKIVLGGPEVTYQSDDLLGRFADLIIKGEGEKPFFSLVQNLIQRNEFMYEQDNTLLPLDEIPFVYKNGLGDFQNRIIYYETSRGCPFSCQYCLSSSENGVRFLKMERVFSDLDFFLAENVKQVKFVDRTFNCNPEHAILIWNYLIAHDSGITNFHFEISAGILTEKMLDALKNARPNLFQFEIGVQSTNEKTLETIKRKNDMPAIYANIAKIKAYKNINLHMDLIAGLPNESYRSFKNSFNDVYKIQPEQLQLGFLKLLKGSGLRRDAEKLGIVYSEAAPYEVLYTNELSFDEMLRLKQIEAVLELFYNSNKFMNVLPFLTGLCETPFDFYEMLSAYWTKNNYHTVLHSKIQLYNILFEFCAENFPDDISKIKNLLKFDLYICDNVKTAPYWIEQEKIDNARAFYENTENIDRFLPHLKGLSSAQLSRMCNIVRFDETYYLFDYNSQESKIALAAKQANAADITREMRVYNDKKRKG